MNTVQSARHEFLSVSVNALRSRERTLLVITHYQRLLDYIVPDRIHVFANGRIVTSGDKELALDLQQYGYGWIEQRALASRAPATLGVAP